MIREKKERIILQYLKKVNELSRTLELYIRTFNINESTLDALLGDARELKNVLFNYTDDIEGRIKDIIEVKPFNREVIDHASRRD